MQSRDEDFSVVPFQLLLLVGLCLETLQSFVHMTKDIELQAGSVSASNGTPGFNISPCYLWGIQSFPLSLLPHRAWATAKLSWTCPNTKELSRFKTESQPKKPTLWPTPPLTSYSPAIRVNCKHIVPTAWLIEKNSCYLGAWFSHLAYSQGSAINYYYICWLCKLLKHPECLHRGMLFLSMIWNSQET